MSPSSPDHLTRQSARRRRDDEKNGIERWIAHVFAGFAQTTVLGLPVLWVVLQTPYIYVEAKTAAIAGYAATILAAGTIRGGYVSVGRPWPTLSAATMAERGGSLRFLRRAGLLSATLMVATYGASVLDLATGSWVLGIVSAAGFGALGAGLFPHLDRDATSWTLARAGYYVAGLGLVAATTDPFNRDVGSALSPELFFFLVGLCLADVLLGLRG
jgi:predicted outer membrane lipoprotein